MASSGLGRSCGLRLTRAARSGRTADVIHAAGAVKTFWLSSLRRAPNGCSSCPDLPSLSAPDTRPIPPAAGGLGSKRPEFGSERRRCSSNGGAAPGGPEAAAAAERVSSGALAEAPTPPAKRAGGGRLERAHSQIFRL